MTSVDAVIRSVGLVGFEVMLLIVLNRIAPHRRAKDLNYTPLHERLKSVRDDLERRATQWRR